jgi:putative transposase
MQKGLRSRAHSVGQNAYHLVWKPKYADPVFRSQHFRRVCDGVLRMVAFQHNMYVYELQVMPDHVHLFVEVPPTLCVSQALRLFKGISSRVLRRNFSYLRERKCLWSPGKFFRSVGNVTSDVIAHYIRESQGGWNFARQKKLASFAT